MRFELEIVPLNLIDLLYYYTHKVSAIPWCRVLYMAMVEEKEDNEKTT